MSASQTQARATGAGDGLPLFASRRGRAAGARRLCLSSCAVGAVTILIVWIAVTTLLRQGRLETVLSAGRAELAAPLLVALVVTTGIRERIWPAERRPVPVEQDGSAGSALLVFTEQLAGPFRARS